MKQAEPLVVVYDGRCPICCAAMDKLEARYGERVRRMDFRIVPPPEIHPSLTEEGCQARMHVLAEGRVYGGAEAVVRLSRLDPVWGIPTRLYDVPPIGWLAERIYAFVSRNRFTISKLLGLKQEAACTEACQIHAPKKKR